MILEGGTMTANSVNNVIVYHDETKDEKLKLKGHILFFVPVTRTVISETPLFGEYVEEYKPGDDLFSKIMKIREDYRWNKKFHFCEISGTRWGGYDLAHRRLIEIGVDALLQKRSTLFAHPLGCKMAIIFYSASHRLEKYGGNTKQEKELRFDETMLRILLKGAVHYLFCEENSVNVKNIYTDGFPHHRKINEDRILNRILINSSDITSSLRDYVTFEESAGIVSLNSDHSLYEKNSPEYIHANFLQLADMLLGSVIQSCCKGIKTWRRPPAFGATEIKKKEIIATPVKLMLEKTKRRSGFINSGHYRSFNISKIDFKDGGLYFSNLDPLKLSIIEQSGQLSFLYENQNLE